VVEREHYAIARDTRVYELNRNTGICAIVLNPYFITQNVGMYKTTMDPSMADPPLMD